MASDRSSPKELVEFARWIEETPKTVFPSTLTSVGWKNSRLVSVRSERDISEEIARSKKTQDGDVVVFGGARIAATLTRLGLVDQYRLKIQPIVLGKGLPLFAGLNARSNLKLVRCREFESGVLGVSYRIGQS